MSLPLSFPARSVSYSLRRHPGLLIALALLTLGGCAQPGQEFQTGQPESVLVAKLGPPREVYALPDGGKRLMWPTQPMGEVTTAADVDSSSRIIRIRQALQPDNFSRATIGKWTKNDVLSNFGKPVEKVYFPLMQREAWSYRFRNGSWYEMYHFYFDHDGVLQLTQETMDLYHDQSPTDAF